MPQYLVECGILILSLNTCSLRENSKAEGISEKVEHLVEFQKREEETEETNGVMIVFTIGMYVSHS